MQSFLFIALFAALAGRVLAFTQITVGGVATTSPIGNLLNAPAGPVNDACVAQCSQAKTLFDACNDNAICQCSDPVLKPFVDCHQCYFTTLIKLNARAPEPHVGNIAVLNGLSAACVAAQMPPSQNVSVGLALPNSWDGPRAIDLGLPVEILGCIIISGMAVSALLIFGTM
ncbi:hypothetical protein BDV98DRAFT_565172 [Pterulicium gracile]|uniref:Extracellular membrane protein CFEM domain-containing protein n=1 Tax=Pterulicium gracile TaxID=1884261 RepID=A0A5C3QMF7_9AGAR|nr:hypothetical protein BDV98DRAFT_565172 [Pterula gracilis]